MTESMFSDERIQEMIDNEALVEAQKAEIERLMARMEAARAILEKDDGRGAHSEGWCLGGCLKARLKAALFDGEQPPVSLAKMRKPEERAKNERSAAALDAIAAYGQSQRKPEPLGRCPVDGKECDCIMPCSIDGQTK